MRGRAAKPAADVSPPPPRRGLPQRSPSSFLSVAAFASAANMRVLDPLLIQLGDEFHVTRGAASIAATAFLLANGVFVLVHGPFGDRYGKMPVVAIACIARRAVLPAERARRPRLACSLARFLTGVASSAIIPLAIAWLGDNVGYEQRQATLARFLTGQTLGLMTGAALGGALGDWLGWRSVFWVLAAIYVAAGVALFAVMRARPDIGAARRARPGLDDRPDAGRAATALGAHGHHRRGARGRRVLGRLHLRRRRPAPALRPGLRRHRPRRRGVRRRRLPLCDDGASSRAPAGRARPRASGAARASASPSRCWRGAQGRRRLRRHRAVGISFYMLHNTLQTHGTQMAPEARGSGLALFALCLFVGQAIGVPVAAPIVDRWGAPPMFWAAAIVLPLLALLASSTLALSGGAARLSPQAGGTRNS